MGHHNVKGWSKILNRVVWGGHLYISFWGQNGLFWEFKLGSKTVLGSIHEVEQLSLSLVPWVLTFEFDLILGSFMSFWALIGWIGGPQWSRVRPMFWGLLMKLTTFIFYVYFNSDFILGSFLLCGALMGNFLVGLGFKNFFGVSSYRLMTFVLWVLLQFCSIMYFWVPMDGGWCSQRLLCLNPTYIYCCFVVGRLLMGCDNILH